MITPCIPPPVTKAIRISNTKWGTLKNKSMTHVTNRSTDCPKVAAIMPNTPAIKALTKAAVRPTPRLKVRPFMVRVNMSLPSQSVPNG
ncbi:hypothetical protein D3C76_1551330 [compost metagenome]